MDAAHHVQGGVRRGGADAHAPAVVVQRIAAQHPPGLIGQAAQVNAVAVADVERVVAEGERLGRAGGGAVAGERVHGEGHRLEGPAAEEGVVGAAGHVHGHAVGDGQAAVPGHRCEAGDGRAAHRGALPDGDGDEAEGVGGGAVRFHVAARGAHLDRDLHAHRLVGHGVAQVVAHHGLVAEAGEVLGGGVQAEQNGAGEQEGTDQGGA